MKDILKSAMDEQRKLLHERIVLLAGSDEDTNNFIIELMNKLPYPDLDKLAKEINSRYEQISQP